MSKRSPTGSYHSRPILPTDLPRIATLSADAFVGDEIFELLWSHSQTVPHVYEAWRQWMLRGTKQMFYMQGVHGWVVCHRSTSDLSDDEVREDVVAVALWERHGTSRTARAWQQVNDDWSAAVERGLLEFEGKAAQTLGLYGSAFNASLMDTFDRVCDEAAERWGKVHPERWHLMDIAVDPAHQGKGLGKRLLQWGVERGKEEEVPLTLFSSFQGKALYDGAGFEVVEWCNKDRVLCENEKASPFMVRLPDR